MKLDKLWEESLLNWNQKCNDSRIITPDLITSLAFAESEEKAKKLFCVIENTVCNNRVIYSCTPVVLKTILSLLPISSEFGKKRCLELLGEIAVGATFSDLLDVGAECLEELKQNTWYFLYGLQFDDVNNVWLYVDILGVLGYYFKEMTKKIEMYLESALTRDIRDHDKKIIKNTIADLYVD